MQDAWLEEYLSSVKDQTEDVEKLIRSEQQKILRFQNKITKIREGFEAGIYSVDDAKVRITGNQDAIGKAEQETRRIREQVNNYNTSTIDSNALRRELQQLATKNLKEETFEEELDIINKLSIRVYPSEDLKTMQVKCGLKPVGEGDNNGSVDENGCGIVMFGLPRLEGFPCRGNFKRIRVSRH